jgi:hypothetical protein
MNDKQQKILEMAKDICRYQPCCNDVCKPISACDALRYAERAVEAGYSKQEWISVDERLPDKYGDYICCTRKGTIWQLTYNPKYKLFNVSYDNVENAMDVTYWMPFPQAPEGGDKDNE